MRWSRPFGWGACAAILASCSNDKAVAGPEAPSPWPSSSAAATSAPSTSETTASVAPTSTSSAAANTPATTSSAASSTAGIAPAALIVPKSVRAGERRPFILYLHGLGASGKNVIDGLGIAALAEERRFVYAAPDGARDGKGQRFWNASRACCDFDGSHPPHVEELRRLLTAAAAHPAVDPKRLFVVGFSNGGFMAHRLACEVPEIAAIASIAGAGPAEGDPPCTPAAPVAVLQIHGDADDVIKYGGGNALSRVALPRHPSALETVTGWATRDGCSAKPTAAGTIDLEPKKEGAETAVLRFSGCKRPVELWTVHGGSHFVAMDRKAQDLVFSFLEKNPKP